MPVSAQHNFLLFRHLLLDNDYTAIFASDFTQACNNVQQKTCRLWLICAILYLIAYLASTNFSIN
jgi:hypothetical protein